jgi:positive regulator of sigma E activity
MKNNLFKDILVVAAFSAVSYIVMRNYQKKKRRDRQMRDFVHFQLF